METRVSVQLRATANPFPEAVTVFGNLVNVYGNLTAHQVRWPLDHWENVVTKLALGQQQREEIEQRLAIDDEVPLGLHYMLMDVPEALDLG